MLASLRLISREFRSYGEIVICTDARTYWRKDIYPEYKAHRKKDRDESDINFEEFYAYAHDFLEVLKTQFPYTVLEVDKTEADDQIGILAKHFSPHEKVVAVSSDKDMKQILEDGAELYDPIKKVHIRMTPEELKEWKIIHILLGDEGDNIPHIKRGTQFTDAFLKFLREEGIYLKDQKLNNGYVETIVEQFYQLSIAEHLFQKFDVWKTTKKDGTFKDIWKATPFGEVGAKKFAQDLANNLKSNKLWAKNFKRNKELVLNAYIPEYIEQNILNEYKNVVREYSSQGMLKFMMKHNLQEHMMNITEFELASQQMQPKVTIEDEWV